MPLFRIKGQPEDWTFQFDDNPDPDRYELVVDEPVKVSKSEKAAPVVEDEENV